MADALHDQRRLDPAIVNAAIAWSARLWSEEATAADRQDCAHWRGQHPDHELAWQRVAGLCARLRDLPGDIAGPALRRGRRLSRRALLSLALGGGVAFCGARWWPQSPWQAAWADARSGLGEITALRLPDGGELVLDSDSAVDIDYSASLRRVVLLRGRLLARTHSDPAARPFLVATRDGNAVAHGTRYTVSLGADYTDVEVLEGEVELQPAAGGATRLLSRNQAGRYDAHGLRQDGPREAREPGWPNGVLAAESMPLPRFLDEIGRYRRGVLRGEPALAHLRVSGVFSLRDTDSALRALADALPVRIDTYTRWWTVVRPR